MTGKKSAMELSGSPSEKMASGHRTRTRITDSEVPVRVTSGGKMSLAQQNKVRKLIVDLMQQTEMLTKKDIADWRNAWQAAINMEFPRRSRLYDIYTDVDVDLQVTGAIGQRKNMVKRKAFKIVDSKTGEEKPEITEMFERPWFKSLMDMALDTPYWGHSLIELGNVVDVAGVLGYDAVRLVPRRHVMPEFHVIVKNPFDDQLAGYDYRDPAIYNWLIELGGERDLGLFLKLAVQTIPKKNMLAFWDQFGEIFGMPIRIGKTTSRDPKEHAKVENMLSSMGAAAWGLFPEGTEIEIKETTRGDAFNVYDKRLDKADAYISKGILNQTMTIDNGSSLSQSQVHLEIFKQVVDTDADNIRDMINYQLLPRMVLHSFPVKDCRFDWDEGVEYTPEQQVAYERMIGEKYEIDPEYFIQKYNVPILGPKKAEAQPTQLKNFFD